MLLIRKSLFLALICLTFTQPAIANKGTILVIHSWHDILWDRLWEKGLHNIIADYELIRYDLDAMRSTATQLKKNVDIAYQKYLSIKPTAIILGDDEAVRQMGMKFANINIPVLYLGVNNNPRNLISDTHHLTGVLERPLYKRAVHNIIGLWPDRIKKILFMHESEINYDNIITNIREVWPDPNVNSQVVNGVEMDLLIANTWEKWSAAVKSAKINGYDAILFDSRYLLKDRNGKYYEPEKEVLTWMNQYSPVPTFSFYEDSIGPNLSAGGWVISAIDLGETAAKMLLNIIQDNNDIRQHQPVFFSEGRWIFSRELLNRWNLTIPDEIKADVQWVEDMHQLYRF